MTWLSRQIIFLTASVFAGVKFRLANLMKSGIFIHCSFLTFSMMAAQFFVAGTSRAGQIYHCQGADGSMSFQSTPCEEKTLKVESTKDNKPQPDSPAEKVNAGRGEKSKEDSEKTEKDKSQKPSVALTEAQLLGTWTDYPDDPKVRGLWVFSRGSLHVTNYIGVSYTHKYELVGNILKIYHTADQPFNKKDWVQDIEIKDYDGKRITFGEGGPAGTRYIYKIK